MKLPISWLAEYIDISDLSVQELADRITFAGIEIEGIEQVGPCFDNIVVAEVRECADHPNSDHLHVTKVWDGENEYQVVCGAPNARKDLKVICARVGAKLAGGIDIKEGVIRGVASSGMLCSLVELGVDQKYLTEAQIKGIEELPDEKQPGTHVRRVDGKELSDEDSNRITQLLLTIGDYERIGDHANYMLQISEKLKNFYKNMLAKNCFLCMIYFGASLRKRKKRGDT